MMEKNAEIATTMSSVCADTWFTIACSRAPAYCAIRIEPAMDSPPPNDISRNSTGKLTETAATAFAPSRPTQNVLTS
jgi:hypothetical protein